MSRKCKTSQRNRTSYIYYDEAGNKLMELIPGESGVTVADIERLHKMDDEEVNEQRRYEYRIADYLDAYADRDGEPINDRNQHLADEQSNPEEICITKEGVREHWDRLESLARAMDYLLPQQKELYKKVYLDKRSNTDIALEEGVSEAAIRNRLKKMHERLRKYFP